MKTRKALSSTQKRKIAAYQFSAIVETERGQILRMLSQRITYLQQFDNELNLQRIRALEQFQLKLLTLKVL